MNNLVLLGCHHHTFDVVVNKLPEKTCCSLDGNEQQRKVNDVSNCLLDCSRYLTFDTVSCVILFPCVDALLSLYAIYLNIYKKIDIKIYYDQISKFQRVICDSIPGMRRSVRTTPHSQGSYTTLDSISKFNIYL